MDKKAIVAALEALISELNAEDVRRMSEKPDEPCADPVPPAEEALGEELNAEVEGEEKKKNPFAKKG